MPVRFIRAAQQLKILDAADEAVGIVSAPAFSTYRPAFELVRYDLDAFVDKVRSLAKAGRRAYTARDRAQTAFELESDDVRAAVEAFEVWVRQIHTLARALASTDDPRVAKILGWVKVGDFETGTYVNTHGYGPSVIDALRDMGDLSDLGITPALLDRGQALFDALYDERQEVLHARTGRIEATARLNQLLDELVTEIDQYALFRDAAMAMSGVDIPTLGLAVIRADLARPAEQDLIDQTGPDPDDEPL